MMYEGESKYHVASILSNMAGGLESVTQTSAYAVPSTSASFANGMAVGAVSSGLGITPTTLSNIEQTFIELQSVPTTTNVQNPVTQSGFVPPIVNSVAMDQESYYSDSSSSDQQDWHSAAKRVRIGDKTTTIMTRAEIENPERRTHRRLMKDDDVTVEEVARRSMRRERNKVAAAKCRQRRVDHTNVLLTETEKLEKEQSNIETELQHLQQERDQLEFILQAHGPLCKVNGHGIPGVKVTHDHAAPGTTRPDVSKFLPVTTSCDTALNLKKVTPSTVSTLSSSRPSTLPLIKREVTTGSSDATSTGMTLTTPSSGFYSFSLDTMIDHTGLTPLTGHLAHTGLTPLTSGPTSCASEIKKLSTSSDSSDGVKTPSSLITL